MSNRKLPRYTLAGLLATALAAPAAAQMPVAPVPHEKKQNRVEIELRFCSPNGIERYLNVALAPQAGQPHDAPKALGVCPGPLFGSAKPPACVLPTMPAQFAVEACPACPPCPFPQVAPNPLLGTWYRSIGSWVIAATFTHDEMKLRVTGTQDKQAFAVTVTAHYTLTKDGLVYGAITGADMDAPQGDAGEGNISDLAEMLVAIQMFVDRPFSFRVKSTSAGMMVSGVKVSAPMEKGAEMFAMLGGLYAFAKDGKAPASNQARTKAEGATSTGITTAGATCCKPAGRCCDKPAVAEPVVPRCESAPLPTMGEPVPPCGVMPPPSKPVGCAPAADSMKQMASDAFGQMMRQGGVAPAAGMTLPSGRYLEHYPQYFAPDPTFPLPRELASQEDPEGALKRGKACADPCYPERYNYAAGQAVVTPLAEQNVNGGAKPGITGTWYRDFGLRQCVIKIAAGQMTITESLADEIDGKPIVGHFIFIAEYQLAQDGSTLVGLITSVDMKLEGAMPADTIKDVVARVAVVKAQLEDKPFAMTCRVFDGNLAVGSVRMPPCRDLQELEPASFIGGHYTSAGGKPVPKLKAVSASEAKPLETLRADGEQTQFGPPYLTKVPGLVPPMSEPPAPTEQRKKSKKKSSSSDPNVRMQQLLYSSEDHGPLRQFHTEWRRFWFNDQPGHLAPERIHGGIY